MTDSQLTALLNQRQFTLDDRKLLVSEWNKRRTDMKPINLSSVRTGCRCRQIVSSFKNYLSNK